MIMSARSLFAERLQLEWLPTYCGDAARGYDPSGFRPSPVEVAEQDAADFLYAVDRKLVTDTGGGRYRAPRSAAIEVLFWEGSKSAVPRPITLWLEPVITIAAIGRLHRIYRCPPGLLGMQSKRWGFDLVAYLTPEDEHPYILGEVKKSSREALRLRDDLIALSNDLSDPNPIQNSRKKWSEVQADPPAYIWIVGPDALEFVFAVESTEDSIRLHQVEASKLACPTPPV
jgi:hypothetical protein